LPPQLDLVGEVGAAEPAVLATEQDEPAGRADGEARPNAVRAPQRSS